MPYFVNPLNFQNRALSVSGAPQHWFSATTKGQTVTGTSGNDAIYGLGGDILVGGGGDDTFYVNSSDKVVAIPGGGIDTIVTYWGSYILPDNVENLVVQGDGAYAGGNALDNLITAVGTGEHTLDGGGGNNVLTGGTGKDIFVHDNGTSNDVITNFQPGLDEVRLDNHSIFTFADVHSAMQQVGSDVVLNLGANDSLTFRNVQVSQFSAHDFMLPLDYSKLHMTFDDEFNSLSLHNSSGGTWNTSRGGGLTGTALSGELEWYINSDYAPTSAVKPWSVSNGILDLTAAPTDPSILQAIGNHPYTSGELTTYNSFAQTYGFFEMRAELPAGKGLAPAFWLLPEDGSWPPELDVMEVIGSNPTALATTVHSNSTGQPTAVGGNTTVADTTVGFHTYGVDWEPDTITWYFDGNEVFQTATPADMHKPMYMLLNLAVGGGWPGSPDGSTAFPASMQIDYVRAYATTAAPPVILGFSPFTNIVGDGLTNSNHLTLTGTSEAFSTVNIFDGTTLIGTATANGLGAWSYLTGTLTNGSHIFSATDTNAASNTSVASAVLTVTVDALAAPPVLTTLNSDGSIHDIAYSGVIGQAYTSNDIFYGSNHKAASETWSNGAALVHTETWNSDGTVHEAHYYGITGQAYTDYDVLYGANSKPVSETWSNGTTESWSYNTDGSLHETAFNGIVGQKWTSTDTIYGVVGKAASETWSNGATLVQNETWNSDGTVHETHYFGITGQAYTDYDVLYGANSKPVSEIWSNGTTESWSYNTDGSLHEAAINGIVGQKWTSTDTNYGTTGKAASETWSNGATLIQNETWNSDGTVHEAHYYGITGQAYTDYDVLYGANSKPVSETWSNGTTESWSYNTDGSLHEAAINGIVGQKWTSTDTTYGIAGKAASETWSNGASLIQTETWNSDGTVNEAHYYGVTGQAYTNYDVLYGATHKPVSETWSNGATPVQTETWNSDGTVHDILHFGITGLAASDTIVLGPRFGNEVVAFNASGATHDILQFDHTIFSTFAAVLAHAAQVGNDLVITADAADVLTLHNVNKSALQASDVHII